MCEEIRDTERIKDLTKTDIEIEIRDAERRAEMSKREEHECSICENTTCEHIKSRVTSHCCICFRKEEGTPINSIPCCSDCFIDDI